MTKLVTSSPAFCLHSRPYRENSLIVHFFSEQMGRVSAVVKGVKGSAKKNKTVLPLLQPFIPVQVSWTGKSELKILVDIEPGGSLCRLQGQALFAGLYVNELLVRLLSEHIEHPDIYRDYQAVLQSLQQVENLEPPLRQFEKNLLDSLGYGIPFVEVDASGRFLGSLQPSMHYQFIPESGFLRCQQPAPMQKYPIVFAGACLLNMMDDNFHEVETALQAKQLMRMVMPHFLGNKPLNSKLLFV